MAQKKTIKYFLLILLLFSMNTYAELEEKQYSLSNLISNSKTSVLGKVNQIQIEANNYLIEFQIEQNIFGNSNERIIKINVPMYNSFKLADEAYLEKDGKYLLFLKQKNKKWVITNKIAGVFNYNLSSDIRKICEKYEANKSLFIQNDLEELINIYKNIESSYLKELLLIDFKNKSFNKNSGFLSYLLNSNSEKSKIIGLDIIGKVKAQERISDIEKIITNCDNKEVILYSIKSLGDLQSKSSISLIIPFLSDTSQEIRRVAIESLGKIGTETIVIPLQEIYNLENDFGNRIAIIFSIKNLQSNINIIEILHEFKKNEDNEFVLSIIRRELNE